MSKKPSEQKPVATPPINAEALIVSRKPRKQSAKQRAAAPQPVPHADSPKVAEAKRVLDSLSESLDAGGPTVPDDEPAAAAQPRGTLVRCAYHDAMEDSSLFAKNSAHKNGYASSCKAGLKLRAAEHAKKAARK